MAIFFIIVLALSIVGMVSLLGIKQWELQTNNLLWVRARPGVGNFFQKLLCWVERVLPALMRIYGRRAYRAVHTWVHRTVAQGVLAVETWLERVLHTLPHTTETPKGTGTASAFLQEVAEHKKKLIRYSRALKPKAPADGVEEK